MDSSYVFIALAALFGLLVLAVVLFGVRRSQLRRALGTFDASICLPPAGWRMGVCRYTDTHLEWLRLVSLSPRPPYRFLRSSLEMAGWREPTEAERARIQPGAVVVSLNYQGSTILVAMKYEAYTGLSSWVEAGPVVGIGTWR
ncbi:MULTISPECIES: DUF2550 domain-containing protein [unclassified Arthrobacter]|uniref:DUF2550 domain-containing protein n=1 Tax=unclassified Arthrobacter TaxID=235627 RepID=UPI0021034406|nr:MULTISPECIES: DUF2550 domain-containing protein [unclassified Arthrobacter]MCQ1945289.1 DUF2550 domain-containing protein [Arthrobacter sp. zg-Y1116]MCQ1985235.1 DUF2550 domain-containing protein [Arthrobacter sp. zg-Y844]MCQ1995050.1 DUF2550 domain-containing protein [Arthrobacter sp. zg-Y1171]UWX80898.1 DUF2550 domain-containing protein [Arthrobacter sp. zg-Y1171]